MSDLVGVDVAARALGVSKTFLYKLPKGTPGIHRLGRAARFDVEALRSWGRQQAAEAERKELAHASR